MKVLKRMLGRGPVLATEDEKRLLRYLLAGDDKRHALLEAQLGYAPVRRGHPDPSGFAVSPEYWNESITFPLEVARLDSPWVPVRDALSGNALEFRLTIVSDGLLQALEGRTSDGRPWPERWSPDLSTPLRPDQFLQLPSASEIEAQQKKARADLENWLGRDLPHRIQTFPPATDAQLSARELTLGGHFPKGLRTFYLISDGLQSNDLRFLGHADAYTVDSPHLPALLLAWDSDDRDDFVVVASLDGSDEAIYRLDVHVEVPKPELIGADVRSYLADRIGA